MSATKLHPEWRQAVAEFLATDPKPGDVITPAQFETWCGLTRPARGTYEEIRSYDLRVLAMRDKFGGFLMRFHQIQFSEKTRGDDGWRVLAPHDVAAYSRKQSDRELRKTLAKQRARLANTDLAGLTPEQQRDHAETLIRCSWKQQGLKEADKRQVQLPELPKPLPKAKASTT